MIRPTLPSAPQQEIAPALLTAQPCAQSTLSALNVPEGAAVRLSALLPQQEIAPVLVRPQLCHCPALTAVYVPLRVAGAWLKWLRPQHETAPALLNAQV